MYFIIGYLIFGTIVAIGVFITAHRTSVSRGCSKCGCTWEDKYNEDSKDFCPNCSVELFKPEKINLNKQYV